MMDYLYSAAVTSADYEDAALLYLLWYLYGRASDLTMLRKTYLSIGSSDILLFLFIRIKTFKEQGLSLISDDEFTTCPLLVIALALVTHSSPTVSVLSQLPEQMAISQSILPPATPQTRSNYQWLEPIIRPNTCKYTNLKLTRGFNEVGDFCSMPKHVDTHDLLGHPSPFSFTWTTCTKKDRCHFCYLHNILHSPSLVPYIVEHALVPVAVTIFTPLSQTNSPHMIGRE